MPIRPTDYLGVEDLEGAQERAPDFSFLKDMFGFADVIIETLEFDHHILTETFDFPEELRDRLREIGICVSSFPGGNSKGYLDADGQAWISFPFDVEGKDLREIFEKGFRQIDSEKYEREFSDLPVLAPASAPIMTAPYTPAPAEKTPADTLNDELTRLYVESGVRCHWRNNIDPARLLLNLPDVKKAVARQWLPVGSAIVFVDTLWDHGKLLPLQNGSEQKALGICFWAGELTIADALAESIKNANPGLYNKLKCTLTKELFGLSKLEIKILILLIGLLFVIYFVQWILKKKNICV